MSLQTTSGRHRAVQTRERWLRLRSLARVVAQLRARLTPRRAPFKAGAAYVAELLTPRPRQVTVVNLSHASIGFFAAPPTLVSLRLGDEVRVHTFGELYDGATGVIERFVPTKALPIGIRSTACVSAQTDAEPSGIIWAAANELELLDRPASRTLTMEALLDEAAAGSVRAW